MDWKYWQLRTWTSKSRGRPGFHPRTQALVCRKTYYFVKLPLWNHFDEIGGWQTHPNRRRFYQSQLRALRYLPWYFAWDPEATLLVLVPWQRSGSFLHNGFSCFSWRIYNRELPGVVLETISEPWVSDQYKGETWRKGQKKSVFNF